MQAKIVLNVKGVSKEDITALVRMIRSWELLTPKAEIVGVLFDTAPKMEADEEREIFQGIFSDINSLKEASAPSPGFLRLGQRAVTANGKLIGTCDELSLSFGDVGPEEVEALENANTIGLVKMRKE